jgi:hypothetical protein
MALNIHHSPGKPVDAVSSINHGGSHRDHLSWRADRDQILASTTTVPLSISEPVSSLIRQNSALGAG